MNLVYSICIDGPIKDVSHCTLPKIEAYAERCACDFYCETSLGEYNHPADVKFKMKKLLEEYDRILYIDADVVVNDNIMLIPDLFSVVPKDKLGVYLESEHNKERVLQQEFAWDNGGLEHDGCKFMFNSGVMLVSQIHKDMLVCPDVSVLESMLRFREQAYLNYIFRSSEVHDIGYKFNYMDLSNKPEEDIYFRHYAAGDRKKLLKLLKEK